ncbi:MAG TPA: hypothetical protein VL096_12430, partial [Pirellulaceae bacterium]|nr:hypothetical protein [Pirellulaceae bacterium]
MSVIDSDPEVRLTQAFAVGEAVVTPPTRTGPPPLPRKLVTAPVPAPTAAAVAAEPAVAEPTLEAAYSWRQLQALPSWLISSVVHLIALLTLALCTYAELRPLEPQTLHANLAPAT